MIKKFRYELSIGITSLILAALLLPAKLLIYHDVFPSWAPKQITNPISLMNHVINDSLAGELQPSTLKMLNLPQPPGSRTPVSVKSTKKTTYSSQKSKKKAMKLPALSSGPRFEGVFLGDDGQNQVVIAGEFYKVGDSYKEYLIVSMSAEEVILEKEGQKFSMTSSGLKKIEETTK